MILKICQLILISFVAAYTLNMNDSTSANQPTSHIDGYEQKPDSNPPEVTQEQKSLLLSHMSEGIGKVLKLYQ
jgi:hypothetical protein